MVRGRFVSYLRVSTDRQGRSGLGLEAQREAVDDFLNGGGGTLVPEFLEIETGKRQDRPKLAEALALCRLHDATLIIAKLDRLARNTRFLLSIVEGSGEAGVVFCDLPTVPPGPVGKFLVTQMAAVAELEAGLISHRTRAALAAAKARGKRLGNPANLRNQDAGRVNGRARRSINAQERARDLTPVLREVQGSGAVSLRQIAVALNARKIPTPRGGMWSPVQVRRVLFRDSR
jgi:DNA invertase Pin-like site-specific DNA recombinase